MPARSELPMSVVVLPRRSSAADTISSSIAEATRSPDFLIAGGISAFGLWLTFLLTHYFPDFVNTVASLGLF